MIVVQLVVAKNSWAYVVLNLFCIVGVKPSIPFIYSIFILYDRYSVLVSMNFYKIQLLSSNRISAGQRIFLLTQYY